MPDFGHLRVGPAKKMDKDQIFCSLFVYFSHHHGGLSNGGNRPATVTLNNHALVYFKEFLQSKDIVFLVDKRNTRPELWEEQERRLSCKEIWQEYGTFLRDNAKQSNGNSLTTGTALNYLGQPKETVRKMYENHVLWNEHYVLILIFYRCQCI